MTEINIDIILLSEESYKINNNRGGNKIEYTRLRKIISDKLKSNMKRTINIYGTIFSAGSSNTDFKQILKQNPENKLFIYNENFNQFNDKNDLSQGGGNGFLRMYRQDNISNKSKNEPKVKSLGIPTASGAESIDTVKESIDQIYNYIIMNQNITEIYYSADSNMGLGLGIFASMPFAKANIGEISRLLNNMFYKLTINECNVKLYQLSSIGTIEQTLVQK
jgi:hypothetical protein